MSIQSTKWPLTKSECWDFYLENCVNTENEIPLSYSEWEQEIYPQDVEFMKTIK